MLPRAYQNNPLPRWAYFSLAALCAVMGFWCSSITLQYFEHGSKALETDPGLQSLAVSASLMFVASEMAAFALPALLTERQLKARRWMLYGFAGSVLLLEVCTIVIVQLALTTGADIAQVGVVKDIESVQKQIDKIEKDADEHTASAAALRAADQLKKATAEADKATTERNKTDALYKELRELQKQKRPTSTGMVGEKYATAYAVGRGILISLGGLVFFGTAGALLRVGRGGAPSVDQQMLELMHELHGTLVALGAPAPALALATDAPAPALDAPADAPTDADALLVRRRGELGRLLVKGASKQTHQSPPGASEQTHRALPGASEVTQPVTRTNAPRQHKSTAVAAGAKCDTGTGEHDGHRYRRVKAAVQARTLDPGLRAIQAAEGGGAPTVRGYLAKMVEEGVIRPKADGNGYELVT